MSEWISVKERLPLILRLVLITDGEKTSVGYRDPIDWLVPKNDYFYWPGKVIHWMELPEPPKEDLNEI